MERFSGSHRHSCQVQDDGTIRCWGPNYNGELGDGTSAIRLEPVTVSKLFTGRAVSVAAGASFPCAVVGGAAQCWGSNRSGKWGNGKVEVPVSVVGLLDAIDITERPLGRSIQRLKDEALQVVRFWDREQDGMIERLRAALDDA